MSKAKLSSDFSQSFIYYKASLLLGLLSFNNSIVSAFDDLAGCEKGSVSMRVCLTEDVPSG